LRTGILFLSTVLLALSASACDSCSRAPIVDDAAAAPGPTTIPDATVINASPITTASVAAMVNPQHLPAYAGPTGSVEGTITVSGVPAAVTPSEYRKCPDAAATYGHAYREGEPKEPDGPRWLADAIIAVTGYSNYFIPEKEEAEEVTIEGCAFTKRTVTMTFGQRLEVKNRSKDFWTPELQPAGTTVLMMATPGGDAVKLYPKRPGRFLLIDHDRHYATADVYVFHHPLHTTSDIRGMYRIDGVPVGKVKVNTSHPHIDGETSVEVDVKQGVVHRVDLNLVHKPPSDAGAPTTDAGLRSPLR
jgi:hypothetical protein